MDKFSRRKLDIDDLDIAISIFLLGEVAAEQSLFFQRGSKAAV